MRLFVLLLAVPLAYCVGGYLSGIMESYFPVGALDGSVSEASRQAAEKIKSHEYMRKVFTPTAYSLMFFLALWWFRTYDSLQRDWRANFEAGVNHVASDTPIRIEIGTEILINVSKRTSAYNREITITFIKRLKRSPADTDKNKEIIDSGYRWGYAHQMLHWLKSQNEKYDLDNLDLRNQDFTAQDVLITAREVVEMHTGEIVTVDVTDFDEVNVKGFFAFNQNAIERWRHREYKRSQEENDGVENPKPQTNKVGIYRNDYLEEDIDCFTKE